MSLEQQFQDFHRENPLVYELFNRFANQVLAAGHRHYSSDAILHRVRWHTNVETRGDNFKINNNWSAFYARLWLEDHPDHPEFFETRVQRGGDDDGGGDWPSYDQPELF